MIRATFGRLWRSHGPYLVEGKMAFFERHHFDAPSGLTLKAVFGFAVAAIAVSGSVATLLGVTPSLPIAMLVGLLGALAGGAFAQFVTRHTEHRR